MAVPKKKHSKRRSRIRYTAWEKKQQKRLLNLVNIVTCKQCGTRITERTVCKECGFYRGLQIIKPKTVSSKNVIKV